MIKMSTYTPNAFWSIIIQCLPKGKTRSLCWGWSLNTYMKGWTGGVRILPPPAPLLPSPIPLSPFSLLACKWFSSFPSLPFNLPSPSTPLFSLLPPPLLSPPTPFLPPPVPSVSLAKQTCCIWCASQEVWLPYRQTDTGQSDTSTEGDNRTQYTGLNMYYHLAVITTKCKFYIKQMYRSDVH